MKIVEAHPPNIAEIRAAFPDADKKATFYAWGDTIFNPRGVHVPPCIIAHEEVHGARQGKDPATWWKRYIADKAFRLAEEIPAHKAELDWWKGRRNIHEPVPGFRSHLEFHTLVIARRLASPLYGSLVTLEEAKRLISQ